MADHSTKATKALFGGWKLKCKTCGTLKGSYHLQTDAMKAASRHASRS